MSWRVWEEGMEEMGKSRRKWEDGMEEMGENGNKGQRNVKCTVSGIASKFHFFQQYFLNFNFSI